MKRKLCFIMSMIFNPKIKLMDEPSTGLDPIARKQSTSNPTIEKTLKMLIKGQMRANGGSTIFTTQTMTEAEALCDRIAIMVNGGLCCITETEKLKKLVGGYHLIVNKKTDNPSLRSISHRDLSPEVAKMAKQGEDIEESENLRFGFVDDDSPNKPFNSEKKKINIRDRKSCENKQIFDCKLTQFLAVFDHWF